MKTSTLLPLRPIALPGATYLRSLALLFLLCIAGAPLRAQIQGTHARVDLPSSRDYESRVSGFYYGDRYYLAFNISASLGSKYGPGLFYGPATSSDSTPPALTFRNGQKVDILPPSGRDVWHMAAGLASNAPYIFAFTCGRNDARDLKSVRVWRMTPGTPPTFTPPRSFNDAVTQIGAVKDVASTSFGNSLYLLVARNAPYYDIVALAFDGQDLKSLGTLKLEGSSGKAANIQSIDATNVTLGSGESAILVSAVTQAADSAPNTAVPLVSAWLWDGKETSSAIKGFTLERLKNPSQPKYFSKCSVRVGYGPALGTTAVNSCTLFFAGNLSNTDAAGDFFATQLQLPSSASGTLTQLKAADRSWTPLNILSSNWAPSTINNELPYNWSLFPASVPRGGSDYRNVDQYLALAVLGLNHQAVKENNNMTSTLSLQLKTADNSTISYPTSDYSNLDEVNQRAIVQSWNLLGVITGVPPMPAGTPASGNALSVSYGENNGSSSNQTSQTTVGLTASGGTVVTASAGYSYSTKQGTKSSSSFTVNKTINFPPHEGNYDYTSDLGYLIVSQPTYVKGTYEAYAFDGTTKLDFTLSSLYLKGANVTAFPFHLNSPDTPVENYPAALYEYPQNQSGETISWPKTTDIVGWAYKQSPLDNFDTHYYQPSTTTFDGNTFTTSTFSISKGDATEFSLEATNKIDLSAGVKIFGLTSTASSSLSFISNVTTTFGTTSLLSVTYPKLNKSEGYSQIRVEPLFYVKKQNDRTANWIPTIFQGSAPWIMTWRVTSYVPSNGQPGSDVRLGAFTQGTLPEQAGWSYYDTFHQWIYQKPGHPWAFWPAFNDWVYVDPASTSDELSLYLYTAKTWVYTSTTDYPSAKYGLFRKPVTMKAPPAAPHQFDLPPDADQF